MISALCPSRARHQALYESATSLFETASDPTQVELLVRQDNDDLDYAVVDPWEWHQILRFRGPRYGYAELHRYYNYLASQASGDYLLLWNDDACMLTRGWNQIIVEQLDPQVPAVGSFDGPDYALFPVVTRAFYETLGHFSLSPHCDGWVQEVAKAAGCMVDLSEIRVEHLRDRLDDDTKRQGERVQVEMSSPAFFTAEMEQLRQVDVEKLQAVLA